MKSEIQRFTVHIGDVTLQIYDIYTGEISNPTTYVHTDNTKSRKLLYCICESEPAPLEIQAGL